MSKGKKTRDGGSDDDDDSDDREHDRKRKGDSKSKVKQTPAINLRKFIAGRHIALDQGHPGIVTGPVKPR